LNHGWQAERRRRLDEQLVRIETILQPVRRAEATRDEYEAAVKASKPEAEQARLSEIAFEAKRVAIHMQFELNTLLSEHAHLDDEVHYLAHSQSRPIPTPRTTRSVLAPRFSAFPRRASAPPSQPCSWRQHTL
jgi:hypothetical protein